MCGQKYRNIAKTIQNNKIGAQQRSTKYSQLNTLPFPLPRFVQNFENILID